MVAEAARLEPVLGERREEKGGNLFAAVTELLLTINKTNGSAAGIVVTVAKKRHVLVMFGIPEIRNVSEICFTYIHRNVHARTPQSQWAAKVTSY